MKPSSQQSDYEYYTDEKKNNPLKYIIVTIIICVAGFALLVNLVSKNNSFQDNHGFLKPAEVVAAKMDLTVDCNDLNNAAVTTILNVVVSNSSDRTFNDVTVKVIAYDNNNNIIKEKYTTFSRVLRPFGTFSKPVTLPERTAHCTCNLENIN